jgi:acetylornithine deacetylase
MQTVQPSSFIEVLPRWDVPGLKPEADGAAEALSRRFTGDNGTHVVSFGTEAGQFQEGGYSAVVCGPGNIEQAHQANEFITLEQFAAGEDFMHRLLDHLSQE